MRLLRRLSVRSSRTLCLLSLLACLGTVWLWWRGEHTVLRQSFVEVAALHADLVVASADSGLVVGVVGRWPEEAGAWAGDFVEVPLPHYSFPPDVPGAKQRTASLAGVRFESGSLYVDLRSDGKPQRLLLREWFGRAMDDSPPLWHSGPLPYWQASEVPHWLAVTIFATPPLLWLAGFSRRLFVNRRRRRLGLCRRCGYDLTGNASGRCPECGEDVGAGRTVERETA